MSENTSHDLTKLVVAKIAELGPEAPAYFGVPVGMLSMWAKGVKPPSLTAVQKVWSEWATKVQAEPEAVVGTEVVEIGMPIYGKIEPKTFITLFRCCKLYGAEKVDIRPHTQTLIDEARCFLAEKFVRSKREFCVMVDADAVLPCGSADILKTLWPGQTMSATKANRNALARIMSHPKSARIVGVVYRDRRDGNQVQVETAFRSPAENARFQGLFTGKTQDDGLEETGWVGGHMLRIHRSVFLEMMEAAKPGGPLEDIAPPANQPNRPHGFFGRSSKVRGEDVFFCRQAQKIGVKTFVDLGICVGHVGENVF